MHKNTKLLPYQKREAYRRWQQGDSLRSLARYYRVSHTTIWRAMEKALLGVFVNYTSKNERYRKIEYGLRRLSRTERALAKKLAKRAHRLNRYERAVPGETRAFRYEKISPYAGRSRGRAPGVAPRCH